MRILMLAVLLGGCATASANVTGNEVGVTVNNVWNRNQAYSYADEHCSQYGKAARATERDGDYAFSFDCVHPD